MNLTNLRARGTKSKALLFALLTAMITSPAFASGGGGDFDSSSIVTKITTYAAAAAVILGAWYLGKWGLRAFGMLGGK